VFLFDCLLLVGLWYCSGNGIGTGTGISTPVESFSLLVHLEQHRGW
jgi:hypothetical protein